MHTFYPVISRCSFQKRIFARNNSSSDDQDIGERKRIVVGISHGDINSISYEVIIKSCLDQRIIELFTPVVYGLSKVASYHRKLLTSPISVSTSFTVPIRQT
jgi:hypothetical protein